MKWILFSITILLSVESLACPNGYEQDGARVVWICQTLEGGVDHREKQIFDIETNEFIEIDYFKNSSKPYRRDVYKTRYGLLGKYLFTYFSEEESDFKFKNIRVFDFDDSLIAEHDINVSSELIEESKNEVSLSAPKALIIDSGFNYIHKDLFGKHFVNQGETIDGLDNDQDGLIDNMTTFHGAQGAGGSIDYTFNLNQPIQLPTKGAAFTHGGFVAGVAMKNINKTSYIGVGGDIHSPVYLYKILEQISMYDIRFTNMSFGFGDRSGLSLVDPESIEAVEGIMRSSFNTLHVVASGNGSRNFDTGSYSEYPACLNLRNKITVGALNTDDIEEGAFSNYTEASFSNVGYRCVDVMAPGVDMQGLGLGDTYMKASGTSVSSPYVLNVLLKMYESLDTLAQREYKEILLKTVYVPEAEPFAVKSGGIVFPRRALLAVDKLKSGLTIDEAVWSSRAEISLNGEVTSQNELQQMWRERRL